MFVVCFLTKNCLFSNKAAKVIFNSGTNTCLLPGGGENVQMCPGPVCNKKQGSRQMVQWGGIKRAYRGDDKY
jgi:hypothetical protein